MVTEPFLDQMDQTLSKLPMQNEQEQATTDHPQWIPATDMIVDNIHPHLRAPPFLVLLDPGSSNTLMNRRAIPTGFKITINGITTSTTAHGEQIQPNEQVQLHGIRFPELATTRRITATITANVMDSPTSPYDLIVGRDTLDTYKFIVDF
jgi:hypothetical protein